jgi:formylglycine-generating enzyme required for sulfatase activity
MVQKSKPHTQIHLIITRLTIRLNIWCDSLIYLISFMKNLPFLVSFLFSTLFLWSANPVPYSGKIAIRGVNYDGDAQFTFSLQTKDGKTRWRNGSSKEDSIKVRVRNGFYTVLLGGQGMNVLPPQLFLDYDELYLKVRFDNGDGKGLRHLEPDQRITATPRALVAEVAKTAKTADVAQTANSVKSGGVTGSQIKNNTITTAQLNEQILKYLKPEITLSPQAPGLVFHGQTITLHSRAEGKYLNYQWYKNGQPINGATGKRFVIQDVNKSRHDGNYSLVVSNDFGRVTTQSTQLVVDGTPTIHTVASISMDMIFCPPGTFMMGSPTTEAGRGGDETQHQVTLSHGFYLGKHEVTQAQYQTIMNGNPSGLNADPSQFKGSNRPVEKVSWNDAQIFLTRLNEMEQTAGRLPTGWKYVLPTEAQWEYACRAGTTTAYSWGNDINSSRANYNWDGGATDGNDFKQTRDVGQYAANPWGFFDMHGNVWEWVSDWKANYPGGAQTNPEGPASGSTRVNRGGSWNNGGSYLRSAKRNNYTPDGRVTGIGFRVGFQAVQPDMANPELELFGGVAITREAGQAWAEPGVEAHDARDGNITDQIVVTGSVDMNSTGTYLLTYSVQDAAGNPATATRTVTVTGNRTVDLNATVAMDMIWCPPGTFTMGSPTTEAGRGTDENQTEVTLTRGFYLGKYEVTQAQYEAVMKGNSIGMNPNPSQELGSDHPVEFVSRVDIEAFVNVFNNQHPELINQGWKFVLPTEAEWEYACRAGTNTVYSWGNGINPSNANYVGSGFGKIKEVGKYAPNPWGFYDMHGNIIEWVSDWYGSYALGPIVDPNGPGSGSRGTLRGGSYSSWYPVRAAQRIPVNSVGYKHTGAGGFGFRISLKKFVHSG